MSDPGETGTRKIAIVPCSGIGKTFGTVSREAAYEVVEEMRPETSQLVALSLLVLGDEAARAAVADNPAVTIDGCKLACATKMVEESGGRLARDFAVLDVYREHRQFRPRGIAELNEGGQQLAHVLAEEVAAAVDAAQTPAEEAQGDQGAQGDQEAQRDQEEDHA